MNVPYCALFQAKSVAIFPKCFFFSPIVFPSLTQHVGAVLYVVNEKSGITSALYVFSMIYCLFSLSEKKHPSDLDSRVSMSKYTISWDLIRSSSWETVDFLIGLRFS